MASYRIITTGPHSYVVQLRRWWFPIWREAGFANAHQTIAAAREYAMRHARGEPHTRPKPRVAQVLGWLSGCAK